MTLLPRSAFGQTVLLIAALLLINQIFSYLSVTYYFIRPNVEQINHLIANQVKTVLLANEQQPKLLDSITQRTGVTLLDSAEQTAVGLSSARRYAYLSDQLSGLLDGETEVRIQPGSPIRYWVRAPGQRTLWVVVPVAGQSDVDISPLTSYLILIGILSVAGGWLFVRRLNRPLRALQHAALKVGRGENPDPLKEHGTTEIIQVTRAFNRMARGIKQLENDRALLTAGISHDLRTPLTRIRLAVEMLPKEDDWIKTGLVHDIEDMNEIIDQFINYVRQDLEEPLQQVNINDLIVEATKARNIEETHTIHLHLQALPTIEGRKVAIKRVIDNLIENAFRHGSDEIEIHSGFNEQRQQVFLLVRDFGAGIDENQMETLFQPFTQGDKARGSSGSGLGLAIIKRIVDMHGGEVTLGNHPQGGLIARVHLPQH